MNVSRPSTSSIVLSLTLVLLAGCSRSKNNAISDETINTNALEVQLIDSQTERKLLIDGRIKELIDTTDWSSSLKYAAVLELPMHFFMGARKMMLVGLGSGTVARTYRRKGWDVEIVEPESTIINVARRSFGFQDSAMTIHNDDGRKFLQAHQSAYDVILVDAVSTIPPRPHLLTREFFALASHELVNDGILGIALECYRWDDPMIASAAATLGTVFHHVVALPTSEPPNRFGAVVLLASNRSLEDLLQDTNRNDNLDPHWRYSGDYQKTHAWDNRFVPDIHASKVQSDAENGWKEFFANVMDPSRKDSADYFP